MITASIVAVFSLVGWWSPLPTINAGAAPKTSGHCTSVDDKGRILAFGGLTGYKMPAVCSNKVWRFEDECVWRHIHVDGPAPSPRMYAASAVLGEYLYVFGGWNSQDDDAPFKDDVWRLHTRFLEWEKIGTLPDGPVSRHAACTVGGNIVVHTFRGTYTLGPETDYELKKKEVSGTPPDGLSMCTFTALNDHEAFLFGGSTKHQVMSSDAYLLNTKEWKWTLLKPNDGERPGPRASAAAARIDDLSCVVYGGGEIGTKGYDQGRGLHGLSEVWHATVWGDDIIWTRIETNNYGDEPMPRVATSLDPLREDTMILQGGWDPSSGVTFQSTYMLMMNNSPQKKLGTNKVIGKS